MHFINLLVLVLVSFWLLSFVLFLACQYPSCDMASMLVWVDECVGHLVWPVTHDLLDQQFLIVQSYISSVVNP